MMITCAKTNLPILGGPGWVGHPFSRVVLLREGRPPAAGCYDGAGRVEGLDLRTSGVLYEIKAGTACLVVGNAFVRGDTPSSLGRSRVDAVTCRRMGREFVAACERLGRFTTYEGLTLARDGKVTPEVGATLTSSQIAELGRLGSMLRRAVWRRLADLPSLGGQGAWNKTDEGNAPSVGLELVPVGTDLRALRVIGGLGMEVGGAVLEVHHDQGKLSPAPDDLAADLVRWFPPRKAGAATLTRDGVPEGTLTSYDIPELATHVYVSRTPTGSDIFGTLATAVGALGLGDGDAEELDRAMRAARSGAELELALPTSAERRP